MNWKTGEKSVCPQILRLEWQQHVGTGASQIRPLSPASYHRSPQFFRTRCLSAGPVGRLGRNWRRMTSLIKLRILSTSSICSLFNLLGELITYREKRCGYAVVFGPSEVLTRRHLNVIRPSDHRGKRENLKRSAEHIHYETTSCLCKTWVQKIEWKVIMRMRGHTSWACVFSCARPQNMSGRLTSVKPCMWGANDRRGFWEHCASPIKSRFVFHTHFLYEQTNQPFHSGEWSISNFSCSLSRNITSQSMKNVAFHSLLRWKMIILPILTTSRMLFFLKGWENVLFGTFCSSLNSPWRCNRAHQRGCTEE